MEVIPAINEIDFEEIRKKIKAVQSFGAEWAHIDITDGKFALHQTWNNPKDLKRLNVNLKVNIEVHLMVENPDEVFEDWIDAGAKRVIIHFESAKDIGIIKEKCDLLGVELILASNPDTGVDELFKYRDLGGFLILAVNPGLAGQKFREDQLDKIKILRLKMPNVKIEVDGGVNYENALKIKFAGADILISASYIWNSKNPKESFELLKNI